LRCRFATAGGFFSLSLRDSEKNPWCCRFATAFFIKLSLRDSDLKVLSLRDSDLTTLLRNVVFFVLFYTDIDC
jgi:hypothetical protein